MGSGGWGGGGCGENENPRYHPALVEERRKSEALQVFFFFFFNCVRIFFLHYLWAALIFSSSFAPPTLTHTHVLMLTLWLYRLSPPLMVCPPPSPSSLRQCPRLLRPITVWNDKMELIAMSQDQVKRNGPWKKPTYANAQLSTCVYAYTCAAECVRVHLFCCASNSVWRLPTTVCSPSKWITLGCSRGSFIVTEEKRLCSFLSPITPSVHPHWW